MTQFFPNEIKSFSVFANNVDVTSMILQTDIFQEIFNPSWSAELSFVDTQNILMNIPITVGGDVVINVETDYPKNHKKKYRFKIYKISDRIQFAQEKQGYVINCVDVKFFDNQKKRISKSYQNMTPSQIINNIVSENKIGELSSHHNDNEKYTFIVPNMSPFAAINWVSKFTNNNASDFWFYQTDDNEFSFHSYDGMLKNRSGVTFKQLNPNRLNQSSNVNDDNFFNIESYEFLSQHDAMSNYAGGYYGNKLISYDHNTKTIDETIFNYGDDIKNDLEYAPFNQNLLDSYNSHVVFNPKNNLLFDKNTTAPSDTSEKWLPSRKSNIQKLEDNRLVITIPGVASHYQLLGKEVQIELPSHQDLDENEFLDKYLKGSYVTTAIRQIISSDEYKIVMELGKKRLETKLG